MFYELDREVVAAFRKPNEQVIQKLKDLAPGSLVDGEVKTEDVDMVTPTQEDTTEMDGIVGDKRKLYEILCCPC